MKVSDLCPMFVKTIVKTNRITSKRYSYYRLCESYRIGNKTRHKSILSLGTLDELKNEQERKMLADTIERLLNNGQQALFELIPEHVENLAKKFYLIIKQK